MSRATADLAGADEDVAKIARDAFAALAAALRRCRPRTGEVSKEPDADSLGYLLLTVVRGIDCTAKAGVAKTVLSDVTDAAIGLITRP